MGDSSFIYVDSSPEPEILPPSLSASTTAKGKGKAVARPPPVDEDIIVISDDDDSGPPATRIRAEYGVPGPSGTSAILRAARSQVQQAPYAYLQGNGSTTRDTVAATREQSPIPQWVIDDLMTDDAVAEPSSLNHNKARSSPQAFVQHSVTGNNRPIPLRESPPPMDAFDVQPHHEAPLAPKDEIATSININGTQPDGIAQPSLRIPPRPQGSASSSLPMQDPLPPHSTPTEQERDGVDTIEDMVSAHLASVLAVIPDVQPEHAAALIHEWVSVNKQLNSGAAASHAVQVVINQLFDGAYPKVEKKKRKRDTEGSTDGPSDAHDSVQGSTKDQKKGRIDWLSLDRAIPAGPYVLLALLRKLDNTSPFWKKVPTPRPKGKGNFKSEEFESERKAILDALAAEQEPGPHDGDQRPEASNSKQTDQTEGDEEVEGGIECGCCFAEYAFENMVQCPEAHLFCKTCARRTAEEAIGSRKPVIRCMDQDGCQLEFAASEIRRFLDSKAFDLLEKIKAERAVTDACLEAFIKENGCPLWDDLEKRHHDEVAEAARRAAREQELANPEVNPEQLKVDLPSVGPNQAQNVAPIQRPPVPVLFGGGFGLNPLAQPPPFAGVIPLDQIRDDLARRGQRAQRGRPNGVEHRLGDREELLARVQQQDAELRRAQENLERQRNEILALQQARGQVMNPFGGPDNDPPLGFGGVQGNAMFGQRAQHLGHGLFGGPQIRNQHDGRRNPFIVEQGWFGQAAPLIGAYPFDNAGPQPAQPQ
ncbi:hypothetical protein FS837_011031 [Tulasnella sp. UAMH 9824]|nr:hypothetical protein FS837_011031 [Tulasnella sp. UAMH 9824]